MGRRDVEHNRKIAGYVLMGLAAYFVLRNIGVLDFMGLGGILSFFFRSIVSLIPVGIIILGMVWLNKSTGENKPVAAWFLIAFGGIILLSQLNVFGLSLAGMFWPMVLVFVAVMLLRPKNARLGWHNSDNDDDLEDTSFIRLFAFMGGGEEVYSSRNLRGGEVNAIMGGYQIDLRDADTQGDVIYLNLFCVMGGVEILVPPNWVVEKQLFCFMGGFSNKTRCLAEKLDLPRRKLIVTGFVLMGGGEIKN